MIAKLVYATWFCRYPRCRNIIYDNGSEFKLHFQSLCDSFGLKRKPTSVKNPQANAILERIHQTIANMMHTAELDMADTADPSDVADFLNMTLHGPFALPTTQYLKPLQEQQFWSGHVV
jgi:transposase InsO family protein